ncbi:MAG: hypothetical protein HUU20_02865 [Pirellulales bacterium]|nr:hypothetical protein [Pirellulales bacterium]
MPIEAYVRANQLVLAYSASEAWPIQLDARWIARTGLAGEPVATWDLIVSVHTDLLDSRPELGVVSTLGCSAGLRLLDAAGRFAELDLPTEQTAVIGPAGGPGCVLFRFPKGQFSYAEMVHPADFHHDEVLTLKSNESCTAKISHRLFVESLEKGVVLRARIRGVVLPRDADCRLAADAYWAFAAADPPLGA